MNEDYVIERQMCYVCGRPFETGRRMKRKRLFRKPIVGEYLYSDFGDCPECTRMFHSGRIAVIVIRSTDLRRIRIEEIERTGKVVWIDKRVLQGLFVVVEFADDLIIGVRPDKILFVTEYGENLLRKLTEIVPNG